MNDIKLEAIYDFLRAPSNTLMVISTVDATGSPESAVVAYSLLGDSILMGTILKSRKYNNLLSNNHVAVVVGWGNATLQIQATARLLSDHEEIEDARVAHVTRVPASKKYADDPEQRWFELRPYWFRLTDFTESPEKITELSNEA